MEARYGNSKAQVSGLFVEAKEKDCCRNPWRKEKEVKDALLTKKQLAALFFFCLFAYTPYLLKPEVGGFDSYYYLSALSIPENGFLWVKATVFCCLFASTVFVALLGQVFWPKNGWLAGIFVFASPVWLMEFWKFETEQFAYPILFLAVLLWFKNKRFAALACLIPAFLLWNGSILYVFAFSLYWAALLVPAALILALFYKKIPNLLPNLSVQENFPIVGAVYQFFALAGLFFMPKALLKAGAFFLIMAGLNGKFAVHVAPFLAVGLVGAWNHKNPTFKSLAPAACIVGIMLSSALVLAYPPIGEQASAARLAVQESGGETVHNNWTYGHLIEYYGGKALARAGGKQPDLNCVNCIVMPRRDYNMRWDCNCLNCPSRQPVFRC